MRLGRWFSGDKKLSARNFLTDCVTISLRSSLVRDVTQRWLVVVRGLAA